MFFKNFNNATEKKENSNWIEKIYIKLYTLCTYFIHI